ncbi:MAG TPA: helix-turn-helix transcriptional regulator [Dehalococcoidia bacterium]|nr:helix-turn-helix transcriptional regulator [Dehalococcoidia bacterium]
MPTRLTPRELEIARLLQTGGSLSAIANELRISPETVRAHIGNMKRKLGFTPPE